MYSYLKAILLDVDACLGICTDCQFRKSQPSFFDDEVLHGCFERTGPLPSHHIIWLGSFHLIPNPKQTKQMQTVAMFDLFQQMSFDIYLSKRWPGIHQCMMGIKQNLRSRNVGRQPIYQQKPRFFWLRCLVGAVQRNLRIARGFEFENRKELRHQPTIGPGSPSREINL